MTRPCHPWWSSLLLAHGTACQHERWIALPTETRGPSRCPCSPPTPLQAHHRTRPHAHSRADDGTAPGTASPHRYAGEGLEAERGASNLGRARPRGRATAPQRSARATCWTRAPRATWRPARHRHRRLPRTRFRRRRHRQRRAEREPSRQARGRRALWICTWGRDDETRRTNGSDDDAGREAARGRRRRSGTTRTGSPSLRPRPRVWSWEWS